MVVFEIAFLLAELHLVERGLRDVHVSVLNELRHLSIEKREEQGADMRAVHICVRHDDDTVVAQFRDIVLVLAYPGAQGLDQCHDLLGRDQLVEPRFFDIQYLAFQRQDRLELAVTALFSRTAG